MVSDVDMKKEQLKEKIDDFAEELINRIKQCKSTHEICLKKNGIYDSNFMEMGNLVLSDGEISKLESGFNEDSRKYEKFNDMFENLESKLNQNLFALNKKIDGIIQTEKELNQCSLNFALCKQFEKDIFGELNIMPSSLKRNLFNSDLEDDCTQSLPISPPDSSSNLNSLDFKQFRKF